MKRFSIAGFLAESPFQDRVALLSPNRSWTYSELGDEIQERAAGLAAQDLKPGDTVGIDVADPSEGFLSALALCWRGCRWFRKTSETFTSQNLFYSHVLSDRDGPEPPQGKRVKIVPLRRSHGFPRRPGHVFLDTEIVLFGESSGSTGAPKILPMTAGQLDRRADPQLLLDDSAVPCVASAFNPLHIVSFYNALRVFRRGGAYAMDLRQPGLTHVLLAPGMIDPVVREHFSAPRARIKSCWIGGGPLYPAAARTMLKCFERLIYTYGSQEAGNAAYRIITRESEIGLPGDVGRPAAGVEIRIVDEDDRELQINQEGEICYRTQSVISGYIGDSESGNRQFAGGFFFPGDIGRIVSDGTLRVTGRVTDQLNIGGVKISAARIDEALVVVEGVADTCCSTVIDNEGFERLAVGFRARNKDTERAIGAVRERLKSEFGGIHRKAVIFEMDEVPRNENGKLDRRRLTEMAKQRLVSQNGRTGVTNGA